VYSENLEDIVLRTKLSSQWSHEHIITKTRSKIPEDCLGGILADDMGLGKTLSMLGAIVNTTEESIRFSNEANVVSNNDGIPNAKSTLVIVPSERTIYPPLIYIL
jgi:SNF2 family DNA or RNA helicase